MDEALELINYSYEDYLDIDRDTKERVELIFGDIYMMAGASASHQDAVGNIFFSLKNISKIKERCLPRIAPFDLKLTDGDGVSVVQPDVMLFCSDETLPCALFEVLSPSTAHKDKTIKKELYERSGIEEYFLVNVEYKVVDKFILKDGIYYYDKAYGEDDEMPIVCLDSFIIVSEIFE
ncbi:MAG: Uma2 family endonuclease [Campylobacterota bacterium]|nr:Uma2 family endonuclease [Campylobacterota bacterium]